MAQTPSSDNLYLGKGALYFDRFDSTGAKTGELHLGNVDNFTISTEDEKAEMYESMTKSAGLYKQALKKRTISLKGKLYEFTQDNLALFTMGTTGTFSQTSGTVSSAETLTSSSKQGRYYATAKRGISTTVLVSGTSTPYTSRTLGTDYSVDAATGRIYVIPGGGIVDGHTAQLSSYAYSTLALKTIAGGTESQVIGFLRFIGDPSAGPAQEYQFWKCDVTPDGELGLIGDDYGSFGIGFKLLSDSAAHPTEPYYKQFFL